MTNADVNSNMLSTRQVNKSRLNITSSLEKFLHSESTRKNVCSIVADRNEFSH